MPQKKTQKPAAKKPVKKPVKKLANKPVTKKPVKKPVKKPAAKKHAKKPVSKKPVKKPVKKLANNPVTKKPIKKPVKKPAAKKPAKKPVKKLANKPVKKKPIKKPVKKLVKKPAKKPAEKKLTKKPVAKKPVVKKPVAKKPVAKKPVAKPKPKAKNPMVKKPAVPASSILYTDIPENVPKNFPEKIKLGTCVDNALDKYIPIKNIGKGFNGEVYEACSVTDCNYALKISYELKDTKTDEQKFTKMASDLGIGAKVYAYGKCHDNDGYDYHFIVMEKLSYTMEETYPYTAQEAVKALKLYKRLLDNGIDHSDLKVNNIMYNEGGEMKIVDYGIAAEKKHKTEDIMPIVARLFLKTMFRNAREYGAKTYWNDEENEEVKYAMEHDVLCGVNKYLKSIGAIDAYFIHESEKLCP